MGTIPWPPPVADMSYAFSAEDHFAEYGSETLTQPRNKVTGITNPLPQGRWRAILDDVTGFYYFYYTLGDAWPGEIIWGVTPEVIPTSIVEYQATRSTEIMFLLSPTPRAYSTQGSGYAERNPPYVAQVWMADGYFRDSGILMWAARDYKWASQVLSRLTQPWSMFTVRRDHSIVDSFYVQTKQDASSWIRPWADSPSTGPYNRDMDEFGLAGIEGAILTLKFDRVLSDLEIDQIYNWAKTWLPEQVVPPTMDTVRADAQKISATATSFVWDMAHGNANIECNDGRSFPNVASGYIDLCPPDIAGGTKIFTITWTDSVADIEDIYYAPLAELGVTSQTVESNSATFTIATPQTFNILVFRDGMLVAPWQAGLTTYTDLGLQAAVPYHYDFQQEEPPDATDASLVSVIDILTPGIPSYATAVKKSTFAYSMTWDQTAHGTADIIVSDGRAFPTSASPFLDISPVTNDVSSDLTYQLTWADLTVEIYPFQRFAPVLLEITPSIVSHEQAVFVIPSVPYEIIVYRDNAEYATIPANVTEWVDTPLAPDTEYVYRFEQIHTEAVPAQGYAEATIRTRPVTAPSSEYWVSRGGVWVKANDAYGSFKGEWYPVIGTG